MCNGNRECANGYPGFTISTTPHRAAGRTCKCGTFPPPPPRRTNRTQGTPNFPLLRSTRREKLDASLKIETSEEGEGSSYKRSEKIEATVRVPENRLLHRIQDVLSKKFGDWFKKDVVK